MFSSPTPLVPSHQHLPDPGYLPPLSCLGHQHALGWGQQMMTHTPDPAQCLLLQIQFLWSTATLTRFRTTYVCSHRTVAEWSSCHRAPVAREALTIYCVALHRVRRPLGQVLTSFASELEHDAASNHIPVYSPAYSTIPCLPPLGCSKTSPAPPVGRKQRFSNWGLSQQLCNCDTPTILRFITQVTFLF